VNDLTKQIFSTRDIGSGPRAKEILGLMRPEGVTLEQASRGINFLSRVGALPQEEYGVPYSNKVGASLVDEYSAMTRKSFEERAEEAPDFVTKIGVLTLHNLGFQRSWDLEWGRSEMVEWECADVSGFNRSKNWQHSYGTRFWQPREIASEITYSGSSERHVQGLTKVQKFAKDPIRVPLTDSHCVIHNNGNPFYYGAELRRGVDEVLAGLKGDHLAGMDYAVKVSRDRVKRISAAARDGETIDIQWDNFTVACERKEFDKTFMAKLGQTVPSYIEQMRELTRPAPNIEFSIHNCLQPYHLYAPYFPSEVPGITRFHFEISTHDSDKLGVTAEQRTGQGWDAIRLLMQHGIRPHQKVIIDVAPTYEGAKIPDPELVRDRILYPLKLGYAPEQIEVAPACGQRNLTLERMLDIDINIHKGRDLALKTLEKETGIDATPHLTATYLRESIEA
jgi:hypothetical protein